jgi:hypothetical protein
MVDFVPKGFRNNNVFATTGSRLMSYQASPAICDLDSQSASAYDTGICTKQGSPLSL